MKQWLTDHWSTAGAVLVGGGLTAVFGNIAFQSLLDWIDPSRIDADFARGTLGFGGGADPGQTAQNTTAIITVIFGSVVIVCAILVIGLAFRRIWAREGAFFAFGLLGLMSVGASLAGFAANPPAPSASVGMLVGIANFVVVAFFSCRRRGSTSIPSPTTTATSFALSRGACQPSGCANARM